MCCLAFVEVHSQCLGNNVIFETQECFVKATNTATCKDNKKKNLRCLCQNENLIVRNSHQPSPNEVGGTSLCFSFTVSRRVCAEGLLCLSVTQNKEDTTAK